MKSPLLSMLLSAALAGVCAPQTPEDGGDEQAIELVLGAPAPPLSSLRLVGAERDLAADWNARLGEVWVLEFWATWCSGCLPGLDHLARLETQLVDAPIRFLGISPETPERMQAFLSRRQVGFPIALDADSTAFEAFGVRGVPTTVIVDAKGKIAAVARPDQITRKVLERVLAGEPAGIPLKRYQAAQIEWAPATSADGDVFASVVISDSTATNGGSHMEPESGRISGDGMHLLNLINIAYDAPQTRTLNSLPPWSSDDPLYKVAVSAPGGNYELARRMLAASIEVKFGFTARWEERERSVYALRLSSDSPPWEPSTAPDALRTCMAYGGGVSIVGGPIEAARRWFENTLGEPVIDETGLTGDYDIELSWVDDVSFHAELARVGFVLEREVQPLSILIIEPLQ